jgi:hypothetical protein
MLFTGDTQEVKDENITVLIILCFHTSPIPILGKCTSLFHLIEVTMIQMHLQLPSP